MEKRWMIEMFTLGGCDKCETLKRGMDENGIRYNVYQINKNSVLGDKLEETYKCYTYPMVIFKGLTQKIWLPETSLLPSPNINIYHSISELIEQIKHEIKK